MKNRIAIFISILITAGMLWSLRWSILFTSICAVTLLAQIWCFIKNKRNVAVKIGNCGLWLTIVTYLVIGIAILLLYEDPEVYSFPWNVGMAAWVISEWTIALSFLSFVVGAFIPEKPTTISPTS